MSMVLILNEQKFMPINQTKIKSKFTSFLKKLELNEWQVSLVFVDIETIADFNLKYRDKTGPTDVLSFPFFPDLKAGQKPIPQDDELLDLGDIIICPEKLAADAFELEQSFDDRLERIMLHGLLHLLGYDHETEEDHAVMKPLEESILGRKIID